MEDREINSLTYSEITKCGSCHSENLIETHDFGKVPLAGYFPKPEESLIAPIPMRLMYCQNCTLHQISPDVSDEYLFRDYRYVSSIGMQTHFNELAEWFNESQKPLKSSRIVELGCNDGPLLTALTSLGLSPVGIDPASNIVALAKEKGLSVINDFFGAKAVAQYEELQNVDYIFSANSFAHISDIHLIAQSVSAALAPNGRFIVEVQSFVNLVENNAFDFVYHEHKYYYTLQSISKLMSQFGLFLIDCILTPAHGGSYRIIFGKYANQISSRAQEIFDYETLFNLDSERLGKAIIKYHEELSKMEDFLQESFRLGKRIAAFGASGRANMLLGALPQTRKILEFVIDQSPERIGRLMAQNNIPIVDFNGVDCEEYDIVIVLAWNFSNEIIAKWANTESTFVAPLPQFHIIRGQ